MKKILMVGIAVLAGGFMLRGDFQSGERHFLTVATPAPANREVKFAYIPPSRPPAGKSGIILVIFGGRNWSGEETLQRIDFRQLAQRFKLALLAPGFQDDDYWQPEKWSGRALNQAIGKLEKQCGWKDSRLLYYGYSAGGQCANLFYGYDPEKVMAWGVHGCGVWTDPARIAKPVPALITCGKEDSERCELSRRFALKSGELEWRRLWLELPGGHELSPEAVDLARLFFAAVLTGEKETFWGDDQSGARETEPKKIDPELRSYLPGQTIRREWRQLRGKE